MAILIKNALIISPGSEHHNKRSDLLVEAGKIVTVKKNIVNDSAKIIETDGLCVSPGWLDMQADFCEPSEEHKETIETGSKAAAAGGFTGVCLHGNGNHSINNKATVEFILNKADKLVNLYPFGSISHKTEGKELAEMYDMKSAGAVAFSDHKNPIMNPSLLIRALQYTSGFNSFVSVHCNDKFLSQGGQMNEGVVSTSLGLKGIPAIAEELMLERNISLLEYAGGKLHVATISTAGSVELIRKAKAKGLNISAGVAAINLLYDDGQLKDFNTNLKTDPPLRTKKDVEALKKGIENGVIDVIVSDHQPQDVESKELEFDLAEFGIINIQTTFNCIAEAFKDRDISKAINALSINPRKLLGLPISTISEGEEANLTLFSTSLRSEFNQKINKSKSTNSPFLNQTLSGKVIGVINGSKSYFNS